MLRDHRKSDPRPSREMLRILSLTADVKKPAQEAASRPERELRPQANPKAAERAWM